MPINIDMSGRHAIATVAGKIGCCISLVLAEAGAHLVAYPASNLAGFINGETVALDGGSLAQ